MAGGGDGTLTLTLARVEFPPLGRVTDDTSILTLRSLVFEPLCRWHDGVVEPGLFAAWTAGAGGRDWRFRLRPGARFHDGAPCTAEDAVAAIDHHMAGLDSFGMPWPYARYLRGATIEAAAADTVRITTPEPLADLPEVLSEFFVARATPDGAALLGTGPYRVEGHEPRRWVELRAVDPARHPARLSLRAIADAAARHDAVLSGEADAATNLERMARPPRGEDGLHWGEAGNTLSVMYYLDCRAGLFASAEARLAANLAVDAQAIVDELFHGLGIPASTIVSPFHLGHREAGLAPLPYEPERAKALFAAAGGGAEITLRTPLHMPERAPEIGAMVAHFLGRAGIPVRIETETDRPDYARQVGRGRIGDLAIFDSSPSSTFRVLDDKISATTRGQWWQGHEDAELEPMIAAARAVMDEGARAGAYGRCLRRLQANPPWLYLFHPVELFAARPGVAGLSLDHRGVLSVGD